VLKWILLQRRIRNALLVLLVPLLVAGCGFHLRGTNLSSSIESIQIDAEGRVSVLDAVRRNFEYAGVKVKPDAKLAVQLLDERLERRSVSVTEQARTAEYELTLDVQYQVSGPDGRTLIPSRWIQSRRNYRFDRFNIIGSSEEQALLEKEMRNEIAQQIIRSLDTLMRSSPAGAQSG